MSSLRQTRPRLAMLLLALCIIPLLSFFASLPWLSQQPDNVVFLVSGIIVAVTVLAGLCLAALNEVHMDEWQRSNTRFSSHWGEAIGTSVLVVLLSVPWFRDFVVSTMGKLAGVATPDAKLVILTFVAGFIVTVLARVVCTKVLSVAWSVWKSRPPREAT